ncbi:hypothetical protein BT96DRAFT_1008046 [Gymnopus androsaceus JB14]|uniref:Uncharacterized protein n=1 Tax=Gymnopus androsaceus JB14 TaxID=1447944 RepID=A0A6A4GFV2_9AGAR|nr:hypothetical protein BT96DRAFT_1008046 [Gymnopus androsaceus JB14]
MVPLVGDCLSLGNVRQDPIKDTTRFHWPKEDEEAALASGWIPPPQPPKRKTKSLAPRKPSLPPLSMSTSSLSPRRCSSVCSGRANSACTNNRSCKACCTCAGGCQAHRNRFTASSSSSIPRQSHPVSLNTGRSHNLAVITTHDLIRTSPKEDASLNRIPPRLAIIDLTVDEDEEKERQESRKWQSLKRKYRDADSDVEIVDGPYVKRAKFQHASISCSSSNATSSCSSSPSPSPSSSSSPLPSLSSSSSSHFAPSLSSRYTWRSSFQERSSFLRDNWPRGLYTYEIAAGFKSMAAEELEARFNALSSRFVHIFEYRFTETTAEVFMAHQALWNSLSEVDQANGIRLGPSEAGLWTEYLHSLGYEVGN